MITLKQLIKNRFIEILFEFSKSVQNCYGTKKEKFEGIEEFEFSSADEIKKFVDEIMEDE